MARPHIEYIQNQVLPWKTLGTGASRPGAEARALSYDPATKAVSVVMRYPKGWAMPDAHYLPCDEEFLVLDGVLSVGSVDYRRGDYAYLPAGMPRPNMASETGAVVLTFFEGPHASVFADAPVGLYDPARLIAKIETEKMPWGQPSDPLVAALANHPGRKVLRDDARTGERTWILTFGPDDPAKLTEGRIETHPVVEEFFLLDGDIHMPCGVLRPGAYTWRPGGIEHGPVGTRGGMTCFFRCKEGPMTTHWSERAKPIPWDAPYDPVLPEALRPLAAKPFDAASVY